MANKKDKNQSQNMFGASVDPETEAKVDEMMSIEEPAPAVKVEPEKVEKPDTSASMSAPLLPTDKLPDIAKTEESPESQTSTAEKPGTIANESSGLPKSEHPEFEDPFTNKAVDEIVAEEKAQQSPKNASTPQPQPKKKSENFFKRLWKNPASRRITIAVLVIAVVAIIAVPTSRYFILNTVGVRSSSSVKVLDQKTSQPLKNVEVQIGGQISKTDKEGNVYLSGIKLGEQQFVVKKPAFADVNKTIVIGWGSNPLGEVKLTPVGSQYTFNVKDYVSDKPIKGAEATSGESSAQANENGEIVLTVPNSKESEIEIAITADNYRTENLKVPVASKESQDIKLAPAKKHAFVSKRSGRYDVYKIDVDGKNEQKVLAGVGTEKEDSMALVTHPTKDLTAFVANRSASTNQDGYRLASLNIIDLKTNEVTRVAESERIQIVGWAGDRLVYVKIAQGESAESVNRHKLLSYNTSDDQEKELASTNYFNDVLMVGNNIYYSPALYKVNGKIGLFRTNADGSDRKTIYDKEVWNLFRVSYDKISTSVGQEWYDYDISSGSFAKANSPPPILKSRIYIDSPDAKKSLWVDDRDGKGVLLAFDTSSKEDKTVQTASGLKYPVDWVDNDHIIYRVSNSQETSDYILSLSGGTPKKIADVTNIAGMDRWYYY